MAERFTEALGHRFIFWAGWVFTVGGAIGSFVLGQAFAWIGGLIVVSGLLALTGHTFSLHRRNRELEEAHQKRIQELEEVNRKLTEQATESDRRLNAVPMAVIERLIGVLSGGTSARLVEVIVERVGQIERIRRFVQLDNNPLNPRTFTKAAGRLYAVAKLASEDQSALLIEGDLFTLVKKSANGVVVECARLRIHQPPAKGTVVFEVFDTTGGEMTGLSQMADGGDVKGITGYFIQPTVDVAKYPEFSAETVNAVVRLVIADLDLSTGGVE